MRGRLSAKVLKIFDAIYVIKAHQTWHDRLVDAEKTSSAGQVAGKFGGTLSLRVHE